MRLSQYYLPTTKDVSKDVVLASHKLMLRAGMIKQCSSGLYTLLPLGYKVLQKVERVIQEEIDKIGAMRCSFPIIQDANLWQESGRYDSYGDEIQITVIATGFESQDELKSPILSSLGGSSSQKPWEKKPSSIPSSQDIGSSQNDLDIPSFLRKNKNKNM